MRETATIHKLQRELAAKQTTVDALMVGFSSTDLPVVAGLTFDVLYRPAETVEQVGGDWYDVFALPDGRIAFTIGDVCGRGLAAAVKMAQAKQAIKVAASLQINDPMPLAVLDQTNEIIFLNNHHVEFTTAIYGVIDVAKRLVTYACAGHHPPILAQAGQESRVMPNHGFALGVEIDMPDLIREHTFTYDPGMLLVLYTDGLIESNHDAADGEITLLRVAREAADAVVAHPAQFIVDGVLQDDPLHPDDVAVLTIRFA